MTSASLAVERELRFSERDMERFAIASGDHSPLHTDPEFGRRTAFGQCIVYGGLETLGLLGLLPEAVQRRVRTVRSLFPGAVLTGAGYTARAIRRPGEPERWELALSGRGKVLARVSVSSEAELPRGFDPEAMRAASTTVSPELSTPAGALEEGFERGGTYRAGEDLAGLADRFEAGAIDPALLEGIAWASHTVGMSIPSFDGLCAGVTVITGATPPASEPALDPDRPEQYQYLRVREYDSRDDRVVIEGMLHAGAGAPHCLGRIECFPFSPTPLGTVNELDEGRVESDRGTVLVVGGSRGAGGALSLALLRRGYRVHVAYSACHEAAAELRRLAGSRADALTLRALDAGDPAAVATVAQGIAGELDGLVLCAAPPPLPMALTPETAGELADYVGQTLRLVTTPLAAFAPRLRRERSWILVYSAAAVHEPIRDLPQLTAAKAAVEGVAAAVAATLPSTSVVVARVPKMRTDLVNTPSGRLRAAAPEAIARQLLDLIGDELEPGITIVDPTPMPALSQTDA